VPYFAALGLAEPRVDVAYVGSPQRPSFSSGCDLNNNKVRGEDVIGPDASNAWYCPVDGGTEWRGALIPPTGTFTRMWTGQVLNKLSARPGDFAAAVVVAHEFGHHLAGHLGRQRARGTVAGTVASTVVGAVVPFGGLAAWAVGQGAAELGAGAARLAFSKEEEREADYLAAYLVARAGYDLDRAGNLWARLSRPDATARSGALAGLLDAPAARDRMAAAAWDHARRFSWDATVDATLDVYGAAASGVPARLRQRGPKVVPVPAGDLAVAP
jgi:hypothetical protein